MPIVPIKRLDALELVDLLEDAWIRKSYHLVDKIKNNTYADEPSDVITTINALENFHAEVRGFCGVSLPFACSAEDVASWIGQLDTTHHQRQSLINALCPLPGDFFDLSLDHPAASGDMVLLATPLAPSVAEALENSWDYKFSLFRATFHIIAKPRDPNSRAARTLYNGFAKNIENLLHLKDCFITVFGTYPCIKVVDGELDAWTAAVHDGVQDGTVRADLLCRLLALVDAAQHGICRPFNFNGSRQPGFNRA